MNTLLLDPDSWDLLVDAAANIAMATDPYSQAQDAASEIRTFKGEPFYDTLTGVPYFTSGGSSGDGAILGQPPPYPLMRAEFTAAALLTPGVVSAVCYFESFKDRVLRGQVQITNDAGEVAAAGFQA